MKNSIRIAVAAFALCFFASASATVIIQTNTQVSKKKVLVQYTHDGTGVLHTMVIKHKKLAKWCIKRGGCRTNVYTPGNSPGNGTGNEQGSIITSVIDTGENGIPAIIPEQEVVAVPEPVTLALMGAGLLGMGLAARRRRIAA